VLRKVGAIGPLYEDVTEEASAEENEVDIRDHFDQEIRGPTVQTVDIFHGIPDAVSSVQLDRRETRKSHELASFL